MPGMLHHHQSVGFWRVSCALGAQNRRSIGIKDHICCSMDPSSITKVPGLVAIRCHLSCSQNILDV